MRRPIRIVAFLALSLIAVGSAAAQNAAQAPLVGFLGQGGEATHAGRFAAFREQMRKLGYAEGHTIRYHYRYAYGKYDRLPVLASGLVGEKPAVILTTGTPSTLAARAATSTIPIVMHGANLVGNGIVASLARPGGNVTGLTVLPGAAFYCKRLEILIETVPAVRRVGVLHVLGNPAHAYYLKTIKRCARKRGVTIIGLGLRQPDDTAAALARLQAERGEALLYFGSPLLATRTKQTIRFGIANRLPILCTRTRRVRQGCLVSYGVNFFSLYRQMAVYVDKILKGAKPADLPIEQPPRYDLAVNLKTAKALGVTVPASILLRANKVVE